MPDNTLTIDSVCFSRSTGRMMKVYEGNPDYGDGPLITVGPHPTERGYKKLPSWRKGAIAQWPRDWCYVPGVDQPLDLFERANWRSTYPENLKFAF